MPNKPIPTEWITTSEAAELTGYNLEYLRQLIRRGVIVAEKKGRDWGVDRVDLRRYVDEMKRLGASKHDPRRGDG